MKPFINYFVKNKSNGYKKHLIPNQPCFKLVLSGYPISRENFEYE